MKELIMSHKPAVIAGATAFVIIAGTIVILSINGSKAQPAVTSSKPTTSSKVDVKVKNIIIQPKQTNSAASSKAAAQQIDLNDDLHTNITSNPTAKPKDTPPSSGQAQEQQNSTTPIVPAKSIQAPSQITITQGESYGVNIEIQPSTAANKDVTWKTSNNHIATVDKTGMVTGVSVGNCIVTVTTMDGKTSAKITVTVSNATE